MKECDRLGVQRVATHEQRGGHGVHLVGDGKLKRAVQPRLEHPLDVLLELLLEDTC